MKKTKITSLILAIAVILNIFTVHCFALSISASDEVLSDSEITDLGSVSEVEGAQIIEEDESKRGEFYKEFVTGNGTRVAAIYPDSVHYDDDGVWKDIDNTLKTAVVNGNAFYTNTDGLWEVYLPQSLTGSSAVSVKKDGYTVSFEMSGKLSSGGGVAVASVASSEQDVASLSVSSVQQSLAQIQTFDNSELLESVEYAETVPDKLNSRLTYSNVYSNTHITYDLKSNQLKETITIGQYDSTLWGYRYTLNTGALTPVLNTDGSIDLFAVGSTDPVLTMPSPYMMDSAGEYSYDVDVILTGSDGAYTLSYYVPRDWLAETTRAWPVILDPIIDANCERTNIQDLTVMENSTESYNDATIECGYHSTYGIERTYLRYKVLPSLSSADVIVGATIQLYKPATSAEYAISVHKVTETWSSEEMDWSTRADYSDIIEDYAVVRNSGYYTWDVTDIVCGWYSDPVYSLANNTGMMFKADDATESSTSTNRAQFASSDYGSNEPYLVIAFRNNNGLEGYWDYTASSAGRAGTGYVNDYTGNLVWVHDDMGFGGNRMPVSISHVHNANDIPIGNTFGVGIGWRTNYNQRVYRWSEDSSYYVWEDSDGTKHYFKSQGAYVYEDEDGLELTLVTANPTSTYSYRLIDKYDNTSYFDSYGRLTKIENNQATKSSIDITYTTTSGYLISQITDGIGREYTFTYSGGCLSRIGYYGTGSTLLYYVDYSYTGGYLIGITYKDGESVSFAYDSTWSLITSATDVDGYKVAYTYNTFSDDQSSEDQSPEGKPSRVATISEFDGDVAGGKLTFEYAHNMTTITDHNGNSQIMQFNNWGNTVSVQDGEGRAQFAEYATDTAATGKGNQLRLSSKLQNTVGNVLSDSSFENGTMWAHATSGAFQSISSEYAYLGEKSLKFTYISGLTTRRAYNGPIMIAAGERYTFSAYVKTDSTAAAYISIYIDGAEEVFSETLESNSDWTRLQVTYRNNTDSSVTARMFLTAVTGSAYFDCVQLEKAETASRYNLVNNGDFNHSTSNWTLSDDCSTSTEKKVTSTPTATAQLDANVFQIVGDPGAEKYISQTIPGSGAAGDTYVLAGWAKGDAVPLTDETRTFSIRGTFNYSDGTTKDFDFEFNPDTNSESSWQYAAGVMVAEQAYTSVTVSVHYDYNANTMLFDGIQLYREEFGNSYAYDADGNVTAVKDIQGKITTYEYTDNDLTKAILPTGAEVTYTYDSYHNVTKVVTEEGVSRTLTYDTYGNNTMVYYIPGTGSPLAATATYTYDGNRLVSTTDTVGNVTTYNYNADTNALEWVKYPNDTDATRTYYTYDSLYRIATAITTTDLGTSMRAKYTYTDDLLTQIQTFTTNYTISYGDFSLRTSINIGSHLLATYSYTDDQNKYLAGIDYGNEDSVEYTYDKYGRLETQTYEDGDTVTYRYDNSGALASVTDSATGTTTTYYYDFTDRLVKYTESDGTNTHSVSYGYDTNNNLSTQTETINGTTHTISYAYDDDNRITTVTSGNTAKTFIYDVYGRVSGQTLASDGESIYSTSFGYTYVRNTTTQVSHITVDSAAYDVTYTYTYDGNGNILSVSDGTNTTSYVYDSANQLIRENNQAAGKTWTWTYDKGGNITCKTEYAYTTGDLGEAIETLPYTYYTGSWRDLLTTHDGRYFAYDSCGNLTNRANWVLTWEHGRQLASIKYGNTTWTHEHNADGLRTYRSDGTTTYTYVYNGSSLSQMTVNGNVLYFVNDTVTYNGTTYYYVKNLQGDIVAILDASGNAVVEYTYNAWGVLLSTTGSMASTLGLHNPLRYRGYVYDPETALYYLQSRYYDPDVGRFINADVYASTGQGILGNNMFAYCGNNPVMRVDHDGEAWDIFWDIASLGSSMIDVWLNPNDFWAWAGLIGDAVDLCIPFVGGVGEVTRAAGAASKVADAADDVIDAAKAADKIDDTADIAKIATTGSPNTIGKIGEQLAGIDPNIKTTIQINGRTRIPDKLTSDVLTEVKNVKYLPNTQQLRDFADYAQATGRTLELFVRPTTRVAKTVIDAGWEIKRLW